MWPMTRRFVSIFMWPTVERVKGQYDFSTYDTLYRQITSRGMRPNFLLNRNNTLYGTDPTKTAWLEGDAHVATVPGWGPVSLSHTPVYVHPGEASSSHKPRPGA